MSIDLGTGVLSWPAAERRSDRYGTVMLCTDAGETTSGYVNPAARPVGQRGRLVAEVLETRESFHIGDMFRGFYPETPAVGETVVLGDGTFFVESTDWGAVLMGLRPDDSRHSDWLDPKALYRTHDQTVRLTFVPE